MISPHRFVRAAVLSFAALLVLQLAGPTIASARIVTVSVVVKQGDALGGSTVSTLNTPFTDGNGLVGFVGALADAQRFIWWGDGPVFYSSDALPDVLTGGEGTMGVSDSGGFIYSPSVNGGDAVYTHGGTLLRDDDPVPPLPGLYSTFNSRPTMTPDGTAYWIGGTTATVGGSTTNRHLFRASDPTNPASITRVLGGGDVIEGKTVSSSASNFDYWISDDGSHHIHILDMLTTPNLHLYLDGAFVAQEGGPTGEGDNWVNFDNPGVNNAGHYVFTGDTDGATTSDAFLAYDGAIAVREGGVLDGVTLASGWSVTAASINDQDQVVQIWGASGNEHLFYGQAPVLGASRHLLATDDSVDVNLDGIADYTVDDFNASPAIGPGLDLAEDGSVFVHVDLLPLGGGTAIQAVIGFQSDPSAVVWNGDGRTGARALVLEPGRPNPFRSETSVPYALLRPSTVELTVHDIQGRQVRLLRSGPLGPGMHAASWDGRDDQGLRLPSGTYFLRARGAGAVDPQKLILLE